MSVDDVRARMREGSEQVASGHFKIDAARALAKLREHRLADPHHYVLDLLRAAVASGATRVDVRNDADDFEIGWDGEPIPAEVLSDLFGYALSGGADRDARRFRLLAQGVNGALGMKPAWVTVSASGITLEVRPPARIKILGAQSAPTRGCFIHVRERVSWRLVKDLVSGPPEAKVIAAYATRYPIPLAVNGVIADKPAAPHAPLVTRTWVQEERTIAAVVPLAPPPKTRLTLALYGVDIATRELALPGVQLEAWARDDAMRRNASGSDVVDDDPAFLKVVDELRKMNAQLVRDLVKVIEGGHEGDGQADAARVRLVDAAVAVLRDPNRDADDKLKKALAKAPLLPGPDDEWFSVADVDAVLAANRRVRVSRARVPREFYDPPVVLVFGGPHEKLLPVNVDDIAEDVKARRLAQESKRRFEAQPIEPATLRRDYFARGAIRGDDLAGEVGLLQTGRDARVRFLLGGRLLDARLVPQLLPLRVHAVVSSPRFAPDATWNAIREDEAYTAAVNAIHDRAIALAESALADGGELRDDVRQHGREAIGAILSRAHREDPGLTPAISGALTDAAVWELVGGTWTSLREMRTWKEIRRVAESYGEPPLDGKPVVVLRGDDRKFIDLLVVAPVREYAAHLARDREIRARMNARTPAKLDAGTYVTLPLEADGLKGEIGVPLLGTGGTALGVKLLRDGMALEEASMKARYGPTVAIVDCPALVPDADWTGVVHDSVHGRVLAVVREGERRLCAALVDRFSGRRRDEMPPLVADFITAFVKDRLGKVEARRAPTEETRDVLAAPLFRGAHGPLSLAAIDAAAERDGKILLLAPGDPLVVPEGVTVVIGDQAIAHLLAPLFSQPIVDAGPELVRAARRAQFLAGPERLAVAPSLAPRVTIDEGGLRGELGWGAPDDTAGRVTLLVDRRELRAHAFDTTAALPLSGVLEVVDPKIDVVEEALPELVVFAIDRACAEAERRLVDAACADPEAAGARSLLLTALAAKRDDMLGPALGARLAMVPLLPARDERLFAASDFDGAARVPFVTERFPSLPARGEQVILAADPAVRAVMARFGDRAVDITETMRVEADCERSAPVVTLTIPGDPLLRRAIEGSGVAGEVVLSRDRDPATLTLVHRRRVYGTVQLALPIGVQAIAEAGADARLWDEEAQTAARAVAIAAVERTLEELARDLAAAPIDQPERELAGHAARLAAWLVGRRVTDHPLLALPVLRATDGDPLTGAALAAELTARGSLRHADLAGRPYDPNDRVWWPGPWELSAIAGGAITLVDVKRQLERAAELRRLPSYASRLVAPLQSPWREPIAVAADGGCALVDGELAIRPTPEPTLVLELVKWGLPLPRIEIAHAVGCVARVRCDDLSVDAGWTEVARDTVFERVLAIVEDALERLLVRRLAADRAYLVVATRWRLDRGGPVKDSLCRLPLFVDTAGAPVTFGTVLTELATTNKIGVVARGLPAPDGATVLAVDDTDRRLFDELGLGPLEDRSEAAREAAYRKASLDRRRLTTQAYEGTALVRVAIDDAGWRGELVLPDPPVDDATITIVKDGIPVLTMADELGVAGAIANPALAVDDAYLHAELTVPQRAQIERFVMDVSAELALRAAELPEAACAAALRYTLRYLHKLGVRTAENLAYLATTGDALARAKLLRTADGRFIDLRAAADVALRTPIAVIADGVDAKGAGDVLAIRAGARGAAFASELADVLGSNRVVWIADAAAWIGHVKEADPSPATPLAEGLAVLRREAQLLRAGALGRVDPAELQDVRLRRLGGKAPVGYDPPRGVAWVDPDHPQVRRALEESRTRPDRLYLLLAAIYGAINRALDRVTDEDEATLCHALLAHLDTNPILLGS